MSKQYEDPAWKKVKAQTKPITKKGETNPKPLQQLSTSSRPIYDGDLLFSRPQIKDNKAPVREDGHRRVRRGNVDLSGQVDLHGMTVTEAQKKLFLFLKKSQDQSNKTVLIITGKGKGGEGALRLTFPSWLQQEEFTAIVRGYAQAHVRHGGSGAWYVFLRRK